MKHMDSRHPGSSISGEHVEKGKEVFIATKKPLQRNNVKGLYSFGADNTLENLMTKMGTYLFTFDLVRLSTQIFFAESSMRTSPYLREEVLATLLLSMLQPLKHLSLPEEAFKSEGYHNRCLSQAWSNSSSFTGEFCLAKGEMLDLTKRVFTIKLSSCTSTYYEVFRYLFYGDLPRT